MYIKCGIEVSHAPGSNKLDTLAIIEGRLNVFGKYSEL